MVARIKDSRSIILYGEIDAETATSTVVLLLTLAQEGDEDITLYINSPGGSVVDGLAIYDTMNLIKPDVSTIVVGLAASMGSFLSSSGAMGKRYALPNSELLIHQPLGGVNVSQQTDVQIVAEHIYKTRERLENILAKNTGKTFEEIHMDCERDKYLSAKEALEYGLIDKIIDKE